MLTTKEIRDILETKDPMKIATIPVEDLDAFYENEEQRKLYSASGIKNLYVGICEKAVEDYKVEHYTTMFCNKVKRPYHKKNGEPQNMEKMLEAFFGSEFFLNNSGMRSREQTIAIIENTMREERKEKLKKSMVK
jgi:hypothetical protein